MILLAHYTCIKIVTWQTNTDQLPKTLVPWTCYSKVRLGLIHEILQVSKCKRLFCISKSGLCEVSLHD